MTRKEWVEKNLPEWIDENADGSEETIQDVIDSMNEKQKNVMYYLIAIAREENKEDPTMAHNAWDVQFSCST